MEQFHLTYIILGKNLHPQIVSISGQFSCQLFLAMHFSFVEISRKSCQSWLFFLPLKTNEMTRSHSNAKKKWGWLGQNGGRKTTLSPPLPTALRGLSGQVMEWVLSPVWCLLPFHLLLPQVNWICNQWHRRRMGRRRAKMTPFPTVHLGAKGSQVGGAFFSFTSCIPQCSLSFLPSKSVKWPNVLDFSNG